MKTNVYLGLAFRIILLGSIGMIGYYFSQQLHYFLGDELVNNQWEWGGLHYWYSWTVVLLFILSLINCIVSAVNLIKKNYPNVFK